MIELKPHEQYKRLYILQRKNILYFIVQIDYK